MMIPDAKGGASVPLAQNQQAMEKADPNFVQIYQQLGLIIHIGISSILCPVSRLIITTLIACLRRSCINFIFKTMA